VRYERLADEKTAEELAAALGAPAEPLARELRKAHAASIRRYERDLTREQLGEVEAEAGSALRLLGY
jgi:hypothetical protein